MTESKPIKLAEKLRDELALEWVAKDDASVGHCPDCFKCGFDAGFAEGQRRAEKLVKIAGTISPHSETCGWEQDCNCRNQLLKQALAEFKNGG